METKDFNRIEDALQDLKAGKAIILMDSEDRENEGDVVIAAEFADAAAINFMAVQARGLVCIAMTPERLARLQIPLMQRSRSSQSPLQSPFTVSVDAAKGITTGISAADRARTVSVLIDPETTPADVVYPGHLFPLRAHPQGLAARQGHTEASIKLMKLAGLYPAAVICEIMNPDGSMARLPQLKRFADKHRLKMVSIRQLMRYESSEILPFNFRISQRASVTTIFGRGEMQAYTDESGSEHLLIKYGNPGVHPLVRIHSECLTGDVFGSLRCDCGGQLKTAQEMIAAEGGGYIVYLRQEGRGIGLSNKMDAYALQENGMDTVEANLHLGFAPDERSFAVAAQILKMNNVRSLRLLTNNPQKIRDLEENGIRVVEHIPLQIAPQTENRVYMHTKKVKLGHLLEDDVFEYQS